MSRCRTRYAVEVPPERSGTARRGRDTRGFVELHDALGNRALARLRGADRASQLQGIKMVNRGAFASNGGPVEQVSAVQRRVASGAGGSESAADRLTARAFVPEAGGRALPAETRAFFEHRFGFDFSSVRVHAGGQASAAARSLNARAFTLGNDIVFAAGEYSPSADAGRRLLAHELTHVVQQTQTGSAHASPGMPLKFGQPNDPYEREADSVAERLAHARSPADGVQSRASGATQAPPMVQRMGANPPLGELVRFPVMDDIVKSPAVEAARQNDWSAGLRDFKERGGWIRWQGSPLIDPADLGSGHDDVRGTYVIQEWPMATGALDDDADSDPRDVIDPGRPPANDSLTFTVGHYHQHPPLDPSQHRVPANFPVGPSDKDSDIAEDLGNPGVVRDFTDIRRAAVRDYRYGPDQQEHR